MKLIAKFKKGLYYLYNKHLLVTNVVTCGTLLGVGDFIVQHMSNFCFNDEDCKKKYDYARTGRMIAIGFILGPFNHYWYSFLDKLVTGQGLQVVGKKVISDQFVAGPFFCSSFLIGTSLLEGSGVQGAKNELEDKFLKIYMVDWTFWPMAQFINFRFIPSHFRVLYVSLATLVWNSFLSFMKHHEFQPEENSKPSNQKSS